MSPNSHDNPLIPVIDLFAGPGGLGEGFSAFRDEDTNPFRVVLSIEMEESAHETLQLRSFFRAFSGIVPDEYYAHLRGELSRDELYAKYPDEADEARRIAWKAELGGEEASSEEVDRRIRDAVGASRDWVLCGGPPCQAYSVIGRSRNRGIVEGDHRLYLYREYLRILAEHSPPVFIMENVKGLLSSKVGDEAIFRRMLDDLRQPAAALKDSQNGHTRYLLYSLVREPAGYDLNGNPDYEPGDFIIKSEDFGIPQTRHRVIILGVRADVAQGPIPTLRPRGRQIPAGQVVRGLPRVRSGLTKRGLADVEDGKAQWRKVLRDVLKGDWLDGIPNGLGGEIKRDIRWTIDRLRDMRADRGGEFVVCRAKPEYEESWYYDSRIGGVCNHASRPHMTSDLYRYLFAACYAKLTGRSPELRDFPPNLLPKHKNVRDKRKQEYFDDRFRVQTPDRPSTTVTCHLSKDGHYFIHFDETQCRSITVREAARLQTFPDNYLFCGPRTRQYTQVGNAVPPLLARQVAAVVFQILRATTETHTIASLKKALHPAGQR